MPPPPTPLPQQKINTVEPHHLVRSCQRVLTATVTLTSIQQSPLHHGNGHYGFHSRLSSIFPGRSGHLVGSFSYKQAQIK